MALLVPRLQSNLQPVNGVIHHVWHARLSVVSVQRASLRGRPSYYAFVQHQPQTTEAPRQALRALLDCPTGSIGTLHRHNTHEVRTDFPLHLDDGVFYCGFNSPKSYGGNSYFVQHADGNWLID